MIPTRCPLSVRVAWLDANLLYDFGRAAARIGPDGWDMIESPPILFKRFPHQLHQVRPVPGGDFGLIDRYLPVESGSNESLLLKLWLISCMSLMALVQSLTCPVLRVAATAPHLE